MSELEKKLETGRMVSIDIEPGGTTKPLGSIGLTEIIGDQTNDSFYVNFRSPLHGMSAPEYSENGSGPSYNYSEDCMYGRAERAAGFSEVWPYIDAFINDSALTAYGYGYDMSALRKLTNAENIELPDYTFIDGRTALKKHLGRSTGCLQSVALSYLFDEEEVDRRRQIWRSAPDRWYNKWLLHHAGDDAEVNARIFTDIIYPQADVTLPQLLTRLSLRAYSLREGRAIKM